MIQRPTKKVILRFAKIIQSVEPEIWDDFKNKGQEQMLDSICSSHKIIIQAHRRVGKSHVAALVGAVYIILGGVVLVTSPTEEQAAGIIFDKINQMVTIISSVLGGPNKTKNSMTRMQWDNGGAMLAISGREQKQTKVTKEGYGGNLLIVDEAHRAMESAVLPIFEPMLDDAFQDGTALVMIMGVGGHPSSLIETAKKTMTLFHYPASKSIIDNPQYTELFTERRRTMSDLQWNQMYECLTTSEGIHRSYPSISGYKDITELHRLGIRTEYYFSIDVGIRDETVVLVWEVTGNIVNIIDHFSISGLEHPEQARQIFSFIDTYMWSDDRIAIELNGQGRGLFGILQDNYFPRIQGITIDAKGFKKEELFHQSRKLMMDGYIGVKDEVVLQHLTDHTFEIRPKGTIDFTNSHDDYFSSLLIGLVQIPQR